jgi:hypothetical protein
MTCRLAAFSLMGAVAACHPSPVPEKIPVPAMAAEVAPVSSPEQVRERSELCAKASGDRFRRDWKESGVPTPETMTAGSTTADFASHYNAKMNICFYLLTVRHFAATGGEGGAPSGTLRKILLDFGGEEQYGEYVGPVIPASPSARSTVRCKIEALYCASEGEWNILARPYMEE